MDMDMPNLGILALFARGGEGGLHGDDHGYIYMIQCIVYIFTGLFSSRFGQKFECANFHAF